ncbi:Uncharacterised protein [uncultured archaeon]|nr:Uncharacterised protein [uncultured archaeon]
MRWVIEGDEDSKVKVESSRIKDPLSNPFKKVGGKLYLELNDKDECVFLSDNKCRIHGELGSSSKPFTCRVFPYSFIQTPEGTYVDLSFACPAVTANKGPHVKEDQEIAALAEEAAARKKMHIATPKYNGKLLDWESYKAVEERILDVFNDTTPMKKRLLTGFILIEEGKNKPNIEEYFKTAKLTEINTEAERIRPSPGKRRVILSVVTAFRFKGKNKLAHSITKAATYLKLTQGRQVMVEGVGLIDPDKVSKVRWAEDGLVDRYFIHNVKYRKTLARGEIQDNYRIMMLAYASIEWYSKVFASVAGRGSVEKGDVEKAINAVDRTFFAYAKMLDTEGISPLLKHFLNSPDYAGAMLVD